MPFCLKRKLISKVSYNGSIMAQVSVLSRYIETTNAPWNDLHRIIYAFLIQMKNITIFFVLFLKSIFKMKRINKKKNNGEKWDFVVNKLWSREILPSPTNDGDFFLQDDDWTDQMNHFIFLSFIYRRFFKFSVTGNMKYNQF